MAKDDAQSTSGAKPRVYKASEVHMRRAEKPADKPAVKTAEKREAEPAESPSDESAAAEPAKAGAAASSGAGASSGEAASSGAGAGATKGEAKAVGTGEPERSAASGASEAEEAHEASKAQEAHETHEARKARETHAADGAKGDQEAKEPAPDESRGRAQKQGKRPSLGLQVVGILVVALVAVLLMFVGYFAANRWFVYDDRASMQGTWFIDGTSVPITITEDAIVLDAQTEYEYTVDTTAKTITYRFGNLEGHGRYWFSSDRRYLVITDGGDYTMWSTLAEDLSRFAGDLFADLFGDGAPLPSGETSTVLCTTPTVNLDAQVSTAVVEAPSDVAVDAESAYGESDEDAADNDAGQTGEDGAAGASGDTGEAAGAGASQMEEGE